MGGMKGESRKRGAESSLEVRYIDRAMGNKTDKTNKGKRSETGKKKEGDSMHFEVDQPAHMQCLQRVREGGRDKSPEQL